MAGRNTDAVIKGLEDEITRVSAKLRRSYDTHAETVAKFERDMELLKRELESAYQLSARLTGEKASLAHGENKEDDYAAQVEEQLRLLTTELKKANEQRREAAERIVDLQARLDASEAVATKYISSLNQVEQEFSSKNTHVDRSTPELKKKNIPGEATARPGENTAALNLRSESSGKRVVTADTELQQRADEAERTAKEYEEKCRVLDDRYKASSKQVERLTSELESSRKTQSEAIRTTTSSTNSSATSESEELAELRSRIEAAEYILGDYQSKLRQAEIDRDEARRDLNKVSAELDTARRVQSAGPAVAGGDVEDPRIPELEQKLAIATQAQAEAVNNQERIRSRLKSAESLASNFMAREKQSVAEHARLSAEIERLNAILQASHNVQTSIDTITDDTYELRINDLEAAKSHVEQESRKLRQQLAIANELYETVRAKHETVQPASDASSVKEYPDSQRIIQLESLVADLRAESDGYQERLRTSSNELEAIQSELKEAEKTLVEECGKYAILEEEFRAASGRLLALSEELQIERDRRNDTAGNDEASSVLDDRLVALRLQYENQLSEVEKALEEAASDGSRLLDEQVAKARVMADELGQVYRSMAVQKEELDAANNQLVDLRSSIDVEMKGSQELRRQLSQANDTIHTLSAKLEDFEASRRKEADDYADLLRRYEQEQVVSSHAQETARALVDQISSNAKQLKHARAEQRALSDERTQLRAALESAETRLSDAETLAETQKNQIDRFAEQAREAQGVVGRLEKDIVSLEEELRLANARNLASEKNDQSLRQAQESMAKELTRSKEKHNEIMTGVAEEKQHMESRLNSLRKLFEQLTADKALVDGEMIVLKEKLTSAVASSANNRQSVRNKRTTLRLVDAPVFPSTGNGWFGDRKVSGGDVDVTDVSSIGAKLADENPDAGECAVKTIPVQGIDDLVLVISALCTSALANVKREFIAARRRMRKTGV